MTRDNETEDSRMAAYTDGLENTLYSLSADVWQLLLSSPQSVNSDRIYDIYSDKDSTPEPYNDANDWKTLSDFLDSLSNPESIPQSLRTSVQQAYDPETKRQQGSPSLLSYIKHLRNEENIDERKRAWTRYYNFISDATDIPETHKVYIHLKSHSNYPHVLRPLLDLINQTPNDVRRAKITGPGFKNRAEHIVVYATSIKGQSQVVDLLKKLSHEYFDDGLPRTVLRASKGIGIADQPPVNLYDARDPGHDGTPLLLNSHGFLITAVMWRVTRAYRAHMMMLRYPRDTKIKSMCDVILNEEAVPSLRLNGHSSFPTLGEFVQDLRHEFQRWHIDPLNPHLTSRAATPETEIFKDYRPEVVEARWGNPSLENKFLFRKRPGLARLAQSIEQYHLANNINNVKQLSGEVGGTIEVRRQLDVVTGGFVTLEARLHQKSDWVNLLLTQEDFQQGRIAGKRLDDLRNLTKSTITTIDVNNAELAITKSLDKKAKRFSKK